MSDLLQKIKHALDKLGIQYGDHSESHRLFFRLNGFIVALKPLHETVVGVEILGVATIAQNEEGALLTIAWQLPQVSVVRNPSGGDVDVRTLLLTGESNAELDISAFQTLLSIIVSAAALIQRALTLVRGGTPADEALAQASAAPVEGPQQVAQLGDATARALELIDRLRAAANPSTLVEEYLDEFDDPVLEVLKRVASIARENKNEELAQWLEVTLAFVHQIKWEQAQIEKLLSANSYEEIARLAKEWPEVIGPVGLRSLDNAMRRAEAGGEAQTKTNAHLRFWLETLKGEQPLRAALLEMVEVSNWAETKRSATENPLLQTPRALDELDGLAAHADARGHESLAAVYRQRRQILEEWQTRGFDKASPPDLPPEIQNLLIRLERLQQAANKEDLTNIQRQLELCERILFLWPDNEANESWAIIQSSLGDALRQLFLLTSISDIGHRAIDAYSATLDVYTREATPLEWASIHSYLVPLYEALYEHTGQEAYARKAEESNHLALQVYSREATPLEWAGSNNNIGMLYASLYRETGQEAYARKAEESYHLALQVFTREATPRDWAGTHNNLVYLFQILYERTRQEAYARKAEESYHLALQVYSREAAPLNWALTNNMANLYTSLYRETGQEAYARKAEESYHLALQVFTREATPRDWAKTHTNLVNLYQALYEHTRQEAYARKAEESYHLALQVFTREAAPIYWATTHDNMANLYTSLYRETGQEAYARKAEESYHLALQVRISEAAPVDWANTNNNMGALYYELYKQTGQEAYARKAEESYRLALTIFDPLVTPSTAVSTNRDLARLLVRYLSNTGNKSLAPAHAAYVEAISAARSQYVAAPSDGERRHLMANHATLFKEDALCLLRMGEPLEALARLDEGRARLLGEMLGLRTIARSKGPDVLSGLEALQLQRATSEAALRRAKERQTAAQTPQDVREVQAESNRAWSRSRRQQRFSKPTWLLKSSIRPHWMRGGCDRCSFLNTWQCLLSCLKRILMFWYSTRAKFKLYLFPLSTKKR